jgi:hypothetical protein
MEGVVLVKTDASFMTGSSLLERPGLGADGMRPPEGGYYSRLSKRHPWNDASN